MINTKVAYFERIEKPQHKDFIHVQGHCVLCKSTLELTHTANEDRQNIKEEAYCTECDVKARAKIYPLN